MGCLYDVSSTCMRYIVPFKYSGTFEEAFSSVEDQHEYSGCSNVEKQALWVRTKPILDCLEDCEGVRNTESELYEYIRNEFRFKNDSGHLEEEKAGCEWLYWKSKELEQINDKEKTVDENQTGDNKKRLNKNRTSKSIIKELLYFTEKINRDCLSIPKIWNISITNLGLRIFRNGVGFVWYEIEIPSSSINSNELIKFQNIIRELNNGEASVIWEKVTTEVEPLFGVVLEDNNDTYITPFSFGYWINGVIDFLHVTYFAERKNLYIETIRKSMENICKKVQYEEGVASLSGVINNSYCYDNICEDNLPDKAMLFTYASFGRRNSEDNLCDKYTLTYHLTNGYNDSYHFSEEVIAEIKRPFDNAFWYATKEGAAYLVWPEYDNKKVFDKVIPCKVRNDYFTLYLKVLYQSFSLLKYAEKIQTEIPAIDSECSAEQLYEIIRKLFSEINLFLTKSMATSVSHIHHQNEFYIYLKKQLRVHDDVKSVTAGLNALDMIERQQRDREESKREKESDGRIQRTMNALAVLGIFSALADCCGFVANFDTNDGAYARMSERLKYFEIVCIAIIFIIIGIAFGPTIKDKLCSLKTKYINKRNRRHINEHNNENITS